MSWSLHPQLAADTHRVASLRLGEVLLMDNRFFPWLIVVPRIQGAIEWFDLGAAEQHELLDEVHAVARVLRDWSAADKINIAAIGNVVSQLHVHVVARSRTDAAWPRPVWGHPGEKYDPSALNEIIETLRQSLAR